MKGEPKLVSILCTGLLLTGCAAHQQAIYAPLGGDGVGLMPTRPSSGLSSELKQKVLALDPEHVTAQEVREVLSQAPAPRIINIHGGLLPIAARMVSFSEFLIGLGYPEASLRNPGNGSYAYDYDAGSEVLAGTIAWHYEREGLRPMIVGHSLGGIQAVRVLHTLAGDSTRKLAVWNPLTQSEEDRYEITDPLTGATRPVVGLQLSYATAALSGGLARALPSEWSMNAKLREIPDSVEEFTGFQKGGDPLGGDFLGYGSANDYHSMGKAIVRNVRLPAAGAHLSIPDAKSLLENQEITDWINNYHPASQPAGAAKSGLRFGLKNARILWAAEVWHAIKKHWTIELQRLIRAEPA